VDNWQIDFFPPSGESNSPYDYIRDLPNASEKAQIIHRLETISELEIGDWPHPWIHKLAGKIFQLSAGDNRVMFCLVARTIVVLHACRKVGRRTKRADIQRAQIHYDEYMSQIQGGRDG
jgi:phage-related protein